MFIKVADRSFDPAALVWLRLLLACAVMVPAALALGRFASDPRARPFGGHRPARLANTAAPVLADPWRRHASIPGLPESCRQPRRFSPVSPRGSAAIASPARGRRCLGRLCGVALLVGAPGQGGVIAALAVVLAALGYATGASLGAQLANQVQPIVVGTVATATAFSWSRRSDIARLPRLCRAGKRLVADRPRRRSAPASRTSSPTSSAQRGPRRADSDPYLIPPSPCFTASCCSASRSGWRAGRPRLILAGVALAGRSRRVRARGDAIGGQRVRRPSRPSRGLRSATTGEYFRPATPWTCRTGRLRTGFRTTSRFLEV